MPKAKRIKTSRTESNANSEKGAPLIRKLQSEKTDDRAWAAAAIANLFESKESRDLMLKNQVVDSLISCLLSSEDSVKVEALGAFK
jgi:hypothetical protein